MRLMKMALANGARQQGVESLAMVNENSERESVPSISKARKRLPARRLERIATCSGVVIVTRSRAHILRSGAPTR